MSPNLARGGGGGVAGTGSVVAIQDGQGEEGSVAMGSEGSLG